MEKTESEKKTLNYRYGKDLDVRRLKSKIMKNPRVHLEDVKKRMSLFEDPKNLVEVKKCFICGKADFEGVLKVWNVQYVQCRDCSHVFLPKRLSDAVIENFYAKNEAYAATYVDPEVTRYRKDYVARPKIEYVKQFAPQSGKVRWLDIGSGSGESVAVLQEDGCEVVGLELSGASCAFAKTQYNVNLVRQTLRDYAQTHTEKFDVISFLGVLEHLSNPMEALEISARLLKPGGVLAVQVPNYNSLSSRVQSAFPMNVIRHAEPVGHMMLFTESSLLRAFQLNKIEAEEVWYFGMDIHEFLNNLAFQDEKFQTSEIRNQLYDQLNYLQMIIDRSKLSDAIFMVGRKS